MSLFDEAFAEFRAVVDGFQESADRESVSLRNEIALLTEQLRRADVALAAAVTAGAEKDATIADLNAQILVLRARVAELEGAPVDPPDEPDEPPVEPPVVLPTAGVYGPTGKHWPSRTPGLKATFTVTATVDCSWAAIRAKAVELLAGNDTARIFVRPGTLVGNGAGATSTPVIQGIGRTDRATRVLITPLEGPGSVLFTGSVRFHEVAGVSFIGFSTWGFGLPETEAYGVLATGCKDFAWGWSKTRFANVTNSGTTKTAGVEFVECVAPTTTMLTTADRTAYRNADSGTIDGVAQIGCYWSMTQKAQGEGAHLDTWQMSGAGRFDNLWARDTVFFASSNQGIICTNTTTITLDHTLVVGGESTYLRNPRLPGAYETVYDGAPWPLNGDPERGTVVNGSHIYGSVKGWSRITYDETSDRKAGITAAELDTIAPQPTDAYLRSIWTL